ncbi:MAG: hypothetical protein IIY71_00975 [Oscillospiraceae bacterium]|nr:hypothetical protein [Oscillospiraceae bacterium]
MKKRIGLLLCLVAALTLAGCGNNSSSGRTGNQSAGVNDVLAAGMAEADSKTGTDSQTGEPADAGSAGSERQNGVNENAPEPEQINESEIAAGRAEGIDIDLTALSSTTVYSEVYNMMVSPEDYIGKTVKMDGQFALYHDETTDNYYFACIISDATACCSQGIEFVLTDEYTYPDDYPEEGGEICVTGVFDTYQEGDNTYCTLRNAKLAA